MRERKGVIWPLSGKQTTDLGSREPSGRQMWQQCEDGRSGTFVFLGLSMSQDLRVGCSQGTSCWPGIVAVGANGPAPPPYNKVDNAYYVSGTSLQSVPLNLSTLGGRDYYNLHFTDMETEAQKG